MANKVKFTSVSAASAPETRNAAAEMAASSVTDFGRRATFKAGAAYIVLPYDANANFVSRDGGEDDRVWPVLRLQSVANPAVTETVFLSTFSESIEDAKSLEEIEPTGSFNILVNRLRSTAPNIGAWMQSIITSLNGQQVLVNKDTCYYRGFRDGSTKKVRATFWDIAGQGTSPAPGHSVAEMATK